MALEMGIQPGAQMLYFNLYRKMPKEDRLAAGYTLDKYERMYTGCFTLQPKQPILTGESEKRSNPVL